MAKGLKVLHEMKILHRDLKCANVFITKNGAIKLGDLNVSKVAKKGLVYT
jgi:NIMA (never in mitosis gene a)-related kinase